MYYGNSNIWKIQRTQAAGFESFCSFFGIRTLSSTNLLLRITDSTDLATTLQAFYTTGYTNHCIQIFHLTPYIYPILRPYAGLADL